MSKSLRPIVITLAVILVAALALVLLIFVFPQREQAEAEASPEPTAAASAAKLIDEDDTAIVSFEMLPRDGESMLVEVERDGESGTLRYTVTPAAAYFDYDTSKFRSMLFSLSSMSATNEVEMNAADLAKYGLDDPWFIVRTTYDDGRVIDLCIGNPTPTDSNYYVCLGGSRDVYTLGSYLVSLLTRGDIDYRQIDLFPVYEDEEAYTSIAYVKMTQRDGTEIELHLEDPDNYSEGNVVRSSFYMTLPTQSACNDYTVQTYVLDVVSKLTSAGEIFDIPEEEFADYGFANPAELEMEDIYGNAVDVLVGGRQSDYAYYVMLKQAPGTVITCTSEAFDWLTLNYIELMNRTAWYVNITEVGTIEYNMDGEIYRMEMTHGERTNEDGRTLPAVDATLNGEPITETNCRRLFVRTLNFRIIGTIPEGETIPGSPRHTIRMERLDGTEMLMELYELNDRQYGLAVNGELEYYIYKKNVITLEEAIATVLAGGELPMNYDA